jgi:hypothetical protein
LNSWDSTSQIAADLRVTERTVAKVRGAGGARVSIAGVARYRPGDRPYLFYQLRVCHRRKGEPKGLAWTDCRDLIIATHRDLSAPLVWCRTTSTSTSHRS